MSFQRRMATMPWPLFLVLLFAVMAASGALAGFLFADSGFPATVWRVLVVLAVPLSVVAVVVREVRQRRLRAEGRFEAVLAAGDAIWTGRAPADPAARAETRRMLPQQRALLPMYRWFGPILFGVLALSQILVVLDRGPRALVQLVFFAGLAVSYPLMYRRLRPRLDALERDLSVGP